MAGAKVAAIQHPWFPNATLSYLLIYQQRRRGREERYVLVSGRVVPHEVQDDVQLGERFGAGYYRVDARTETGRLAGASHYASIPDDKGNIPVPKIGTGNDDDDADASASGTGVERFMGLMLKQFDMMMKIQTAQLDSLRQDRRDDMAQLGGIVDRVLTAQAQVRAAGAPSGGHESAFLDHMLRAHARLEERLEKLSEQNLTLQVKSASKGSGGFWEDTAKAVLPELLEKFRGGSQASSQADRVQRAAALKAQGAAMRVRPVAPVSASAPAPAPAAAAAPAPAAAAAPAPAPAPAPAAVIPDAGAPDEEEAHAGKVVELTDAEKIARLKEEGITLPPLDEVIEFLSDPNNQLGPRDRMFLRTARATGLMPSDYLAVINPFLDAP